MADDEFLLSDLDVLSLLQDAAAADDIVTEIREGFTAERALLFLESTTGFEDLADLVRYVAPGPGWRKVASRPDETGRLNRELLAWADLVRAHPLDTHLVEWDADRTRAYGRASSDPVAAASIELPGGTATWDCATFDTVSSVDFVGPSPVWLPDVIGPGAAAALDRGAESLEVGYGRDTEPLSRYALGAWLHRWHPGTGVPDQPFAADLLRIEVGTLAWQLEEILGSAGPAAVWLDGQGSQILALGSRIRAWTGWRRNLADGVLKDACAAYVDVWPDGPDAAGVRQLGESLARVDAEAELLDCDALSELGLALVAGDRSDDEVIRRGLGTVDPVQVPPRSIHADAPNVVWKIVRRDDEVELDIMVAAGEQPVPSLDATVLVDRARHVVDLVADGRGYRATITLDEDPDEVTVHVHAPGFPGPFRTSDEVEASRRLIGAVLTARRTIFDSIATDDGSLRGASDAPFLAELVCWRSEL